MNRAAFYDEVRAKVGRLSALQVSGFETVLDALDGLALSWQSDGLATAWWETNKTMQPVREAYWTSEAWRKKNLRYWPHYGRGYVQLTWPFNYEKADAECSKAGLIQKGELLANLDLAMRPDIAAFIMRMGMVEGWFTGKSFSTYLPASGTATRAQYIQARRIINGLDKADLIEDFCQIFERALRNGGVT